MDRVKCLRRVLWERILEAAPRQDADIPMAEDAFHMMGTRTLAAFLAERRGVDRELATAAMLLHDIGRVVTGKIEGHAQVGAELAGQMLPGCGFTPEETAAICQAVGGHSRKTETGGPLEELVRDADVLEVYLSGGTLPPAYVVRVERMKRELGLR